MIKEYIQNLPGGKLYINALDIKGGAVGILFMFLMEIYFVGITIGQIGEKYTRDDAILIWLEVSCFFAGLFIAIFLIFHYWLVNKADNMYMSKMMESKKE